VLTIEKALLGSNATPAPPVTLDLDGRQRPVVDSFSPPRELPVTAAWSGNTIEITTATGRSTCILLHTFRCSRVDSA
jgi:hypothetical protein